MAQERLVSQEDQSLRKSWLVKFGLVVAVGAALLGWWKAATAGALIVGIGLAVWKGQK